LGVVVLRRLKRGGATPVSALRGTTARGSLRFDLSLALPLAHASFRVVRRIHVEIGAALAPAQHQIPDISDQAYARCDPRWSLARNGVFAGVRILIVRVLHTAVPSSQSAANLSTAFAEDDPRYRGGGLA
jgi:hypothetical protein